MTSTNHSTSNRIHNSSSSATEKNAVLFQLLTAFESAVSVGNEEVATGHLLNLLNYSEKADLVDAEPALGELGISGLTVSLENQQRVQDYCTRIATGIAQLFLSGKIALDKENFQRFCVYHNYIQNIFATSKYGSTQFLVERLLQQRQEKTELKEVELYSILPFVGLDSCVEEFFDGLATLPADIRFPWMLEMLSPTMLGSELVQSRFHKLLENHSLINAAELKDFQLKSLAAAYMRCSYATISNKHEIKQSMNDLLRRYLKNQGVDIDFQPQLNAGSGLAPRVGVKPKILVIAERFKAGHAMLRCFGGQIAQLSDHYELILACPVGGVDEVGKAYFSSCLEINLQEQPLAAIVDKLRRINADMTYFPSIGMDELTVLFSNLRFSAIQFFSLGHPATTHSDSIDYVMSNTASFATEEALDSAKCFSEIAVLADYEPRYLAHGDYSPVAPQLRNAPEVLRVAVGASSLKLNADFLRACRTIQENCDRPFEFHFFPYLTGIKLELCRKKIGDWLPKAHVHPAMSYQNYMECFNQCDLSLCTFPFGLTNGFVDACLLGIPSVTKDGAEVHSHIETGKISMLGLPDYLSTKSTAEFIETVLNLLHDDKLRCEISHELVEIDSQALIFASASKAEPSEFLNCVQWVQQHHIQIQKQSKAVWTKEERSQHFL